MNTNFAEKIQALVNNTEFAQKFEAAASEQEFLNLLKEYGIEVTREDILALLAPAAEGDELGEDMLDNVAGGGKIWEWVKDRFGRWYQKLKDKNTRDIGRLADY